MRQTTRITIEHVVVASNRSYDQVKASLEARLGVLGNTDELGRQLAAAQCILGSGYASDRTAARDKRFRHLQ